MSSRKPPGSVISCQRRVEAKFQCDDKRIELRILSEGFEIYGSSDLWSAEERRHPEGVAVLRRAACEDAFCRPDAASGCKGRAAALRSEVRDRRDSGYRIEAISRARASLRPVIRRNLVG